MKELREDIESSLEILHMGHSDKANLLSSPIFHDGRYCLDDLWVCRLETAGGRSYHTFTNSYISRTCS